MLLSEKTLGKLALQSINECKLGSGYASASELVEAVAAPYGGHTRPVLGYRVIGGATRALMLSKDFRISPPSSVRAVLTTPRRLGFCKKTAPWKVSAVAVERGLQLCPGDFPAVHMLSSYTARTVLYAARPIGERHRFTTVFRVSPSDCDERTLGQWGEDYGIGPDTLMYFTVPA